MKYVKRCLVLLLALMMTMALVQPAPTAAKYTTASSKTVDIALDTMQETYSIQNQMKKGNLSTVGDNENISGYRVNTDQSQYESTGGMAPVGNYKDSVSSSEYRQVWTIGGTLEVKDTDTLDGTTHNIWIYADLNTSSGRATAGHLYYLRVKYLMKDLGGTNGISFRICDNNGENNETYGFVTFSEGSANSWSYGQAILQAPSTLNNPNVTASNKKKDLGGCLRFGGYNSGPDTYSTLNYKVSRIMLVDLTATFGAGNEPPLWWCNTYIPWDDELSTTTRTVQWFPKDSKSRLDTAFHDGTAGYYHTNPSGNEGGYFRDASQYRKNDGTVASNGSITVGGMEHINSTTLNNP